MKPQTSQVPTSSGVVFTQKENAAFRSLFSGPVSIDADLPFTNDLESREQIIARHGITAEYSDVWRLYIATTDSYCGAPDGDGVVGTGATACIAIDELIELLEQDNG